MVSRRTQHGSLCDRLKNTHNQKILVAWGLSTGCFWALMLFPVWTTKYEPWVSNETTPNATTPAPGVAERCATHTAATSCQEEYYDYSDERPLCAWVDGMCTPSDDRPIWYNRGAEHWFMFDIGATGSVVPRGDGAALIAALPSGYPRTAANLTGEVLKSVYPPRLRAAASQHSKHSERRAPHYPEGFDAWSHRCESDTVAAMFTALSYMTWAIAGCHTAMFFAQLEDVLVKGKFLGSFMTCMAWIFCVGGLGQIAWLVMYLVLFLNPWCDECGDECFDRNGQEVFTKFQASFDLGIGFYLGCAGVLLNFLACYIAEQGDSSSYVAAPYRPPQQQPLVDSELKLLLLMMMNNANKMNRYGNDKVQRFSPPPVAPPIHYTPHGRRALLVGCNYPKSKKPLTGCIEDVKRVAQRLHGAYEVRCLTDDVTDPYLRPTKVNIMNSLQWLIRNLQQNQGMTVFFHFSGHGSRQPERKAGSELTGMDETICPCDCEEVGDIVDDDLQDEFLRKVPRGNRVLSIMDCCHSGTVLDLPYYAVPDKKKKNKAYEMVGDQTSSENRVDCDAIMISGCEDAHTSMDCGAIGQEFLELKDEGGDKAGGALTAAFLCAVKKNPTHSLNSLIHDIRTQLEERQFDQVPQISASQPYDVHATHFDLFPDQLGNYDATAFAAGPGSPAASTASPHAPLLSSAAADQGNPLAGAQTRGVHYDTTALGYRAPSFSGSCS
eukprot:TRINITY_DN16588_c0_g1_i1.p1 TRINITY_DN16588_c0_g1~~TRINITY_DN16588_c0_g1_i1.p1  ORF type:complete len:721 (+),score=202.28 TRINITY_DN16588_c0_g1_i1:70-2232(+)